MTISSFKYDNYSFHYKGKVLIDSVVNYDGKDVAGVPKVIANIGIDVSTNPGLYANIAWYHKDGFPITSDNINNTKAINLLNAKVGYKTNISRHFGIDAFIVMNNLTNNRYPITVFVNQLPDAYLTGPTKANFFGGLNLRYIF